MKFIEWVMEQSKTKKWHEIASDLGVHPSYLGHIKNGHFAISKKFAEKVEAASRGLCKKEDVVFEKITKEIWEEYDRKNKEVDEQIPEQSGGDTTESGESISISGGITVEPAEQIVIREAPIEKTKPLSDPFARTREALL